MTPKHHLILHSIEDAGMQGLVRAVLGPDYSSIVVPDTMIHQEWGNPEPVAVLLQPVFDAKTGRLGLVLGKRAIAPQIGEWAIPGGFMERGLTPEEAAIMEFQQETGLGGLTADTVRIVTVYPTPNGRLLIFCINGYTMTAEFFDSAIASAKGDGEMSSFKVSYSPMELAFPFHTAVANKFFRDSHGAHEYPMSGYGLIASRGHAPQR